MSPKFPPLLTLIVTLTTAAPCIAAGDTGEAGLSNVGAGLLIIAIALVLLAALLFRSRIGGLVRTLAERGGKQRLRRALKASGSDVIEDFILPGAYGGLTRIDFAVLTSGGILCIRAKHYDGIVFGDPDEPQWTHVDGVHRRKFLNPRIQNEGRSRALQNVVPNVPVASVVVFTGDVQFSTTPAPNVIHLRQLESFVAKFEFGPCKVEDWDAVWMSVRAAALTDEDSRKDFDAQLSFS